MMGEPVLLAVVIAVANINCYYQLLLHANGRAPKLCLGSQTHIKSSYLIFSIHISFHKIF